MTNKGVSMEYLETLEPFPCLSGSGRETPAGPRASPQQNGVPRLTAPDWPSVLFSSDPVRFPTPHQNLSSVLLPLCHWPQENLYCMAQSDHSKVWGLDTPAPAPFFYPLANNCRQVSGNLVQVNCKQPSRSPFESEETCSHLPLNLLVRSYHHQPNWLKSGCNRNRTL